MAKGAYTPIWPLTGNCFSYGRIGSGKSFIVKTFAEHYYEKGCKIWDFFGGKRGEGPFWAFPSDEIKLWREYEQVVGIMDIYGPKEYPVNLVFPFFYDELPRELPEKKPRISCKPMTIYFKEVTAADISLVIGNVSQQAKYVWNYIVKELDDEANGQDIMNLMNGKFKRYKELTIYKSFIFPLCQAKILVGKKCIHNLDLIAEAKKKKEVFVLCDDFTPEEFKLFIMGFLIRRLLKHVMDDKTHKHNIAVFREMSLFMKVIDASAQNAGQTQNFRGLITDVARYARSGLFIFGDTQSPQEVKGMVSGSEDLLILNEMPSPSDRDCACEPLRKDMRISSAQVSYIATMPVWEAVVVERGKKAQLIKRVQPPRTKCWKQNDVNFMSAWKNIYNTYVDLNPMKDEIYTLYKETDHSDTDEEVLETGNSQTEDQKQNELENSDNFTKQMDKLERKQSKEEEISKLLKIKAEKIHNDATGKMVADDEKTGLKTSDDLYNNEKDNKPSQEEEAEKEQSEALEGLEFM